MASNPSRLQHRIELGPHRWVARRGSGFMVVVIITAALLLGTMMVLAEAMR